MNKEEHKKYLETIHWYELKQRALMRAKHKCEQCESSIKLEVHHNFYRPDLLDTELGDLTVLCKVCHKTKHGIKIYPTDYNTTVYNHKHGLIGENYKNTVKKNKKSKYKRISRQRWASNAKRKGWSF